MNQDKSREQLSAMMDGEDDFRGLSPQSADFVRAVAADNASRRDWLIYAQIGDVLRSSDLTPLPNEGDFLQRVSAAIAREPIVLQPQPLVASAAGESAQVARHRRPHWSTRMAAGMAAVAGVAVMAWVALPGLQNAGQQAQPASAQRQVLASVGGGSAVGQLPVVDRQGGAALGPSARADLIQADLQTRSAQGGAQIVPVSTQMPMVEYLLAHQQMAGGMMPVAPATLRMAESRQAAPAASH
ncbi:sigma-E factor negative regulatory protein [Thiomonas intermedia]|uniref:sigma-E factor negative regulatory protein n=1 Tax=Thiomonas intermedia TaxID=926 RepID=UPI0009A47F24|nr:sigma-E factor negative regulatory protein [Thiomonas intermedia]